MLQTNNIPKAATFIKDSISALTHFIAAMAAIFAMPVLLICAAAKGHTIKSLISLGVFMVSMIYLYAASTAYHTFKLFDVRNILKRVDHMMIYVLIAGSYTPICAMVLRGMTGTRLLIEVWILAAVGIIFTAFWVTCPKWLSSVIYISMGWTCLSVFKSLYLELTPTEFRWLLAGGIIYTLGGIIYALKPKFFRNRKFGNHELFHLFVMGGSACHFAVMCLL